MKANGMQKKKMTGNGFLLLITIALFAVMYIAGMIIFADKGFAKPQMFWKKHNRFFVIFAPFFRKSFFRIYYFQFYTKRDIIYCSSLYQIKREKSTFLSPKYPKSIYYFWWNLSFLSIVFIFKPSLLPVYIRIMSIS